MDNFVVTAEIFLRMVYIILRMDSNIPIILSGEKGVGKIQ